MVSIRGHDFFVLLLVAWIFISCHLAVKIAAVSNWGKCANPECTKPIAEGRTVQGYHRKDPQFLSFKQDEKVLIFSTEAGPKADLLIVEIGKKRGFANSRFIREEKILVGKEEVNFSVVVPEAKYPQSGLEVKEKEKIPLYGDRALSENTDAIETEHSSGDDDRSSWENKSETSVSDSAVNIEETVQSDNALSSKNTTCEENEEGLCLSGSDFHSNIEKHPSSGDETSFSQTALKDAKDNTVAESHENNVAISHESAQNMKEPSEQAHADNTTTASGDVVNDNENIKKSSTEKRVASLGNDMLERPLNMQVGGQVAESDALPKDVKLSGEENHSGQTAEGKLIRSDILPSPAIDIIDGTTIHHSDDLVMYDSEDQEPSDVSSIPSATPIHEHLVSDATDSSTPQALEEGTHANTVSSVSQVLNKAGISPLLTDHSESSGEQTAVDELDLQSASHSHLKDSASPGGRLSTYSISTNANKPDSSETALHDYVAENSEEVPLLDMKSSGREAKYVKSVDGEDELKSAAPLNEPEAEFTAPKPNSVISSADTSAQEDSASGSGFFSWFATPSLGTEIFDTDTEKESDIMLPDSDTSSSSSSHSVNEETGSGTATEVGTTGSSLGSGIRGENGTGSSSETADYVAPEEVAQNGSLSAKDVQQHLSLAVKNAQTDHLATVSTSEAVVSFTSEDTAGSKSANITSDIKVRDLKYTESKNAFVSTSGDVSSGSMQPDMMHTEIADGPSSSIQGNVDVQQENAAPGYKEGGLSGTDLSKEASALRDVTLDSAKVSSEQTLPPLPLVPLEPEEPVIHLHSRTDTKFDSEKEQSDPKTSDDKDIVREPQSLVDNLLDAAQPMLSEGLLLGIEAESERVRLSGGTLVLLSVVAGTVIVLYAVHLCVVKMSLESPLKKHLNELEHSQRLLQAENRSLQEQASHAFSTNLNQVASETEAIIREKEEMKTEYEEERQTLCNRISQLQSELEESAANGLEMHRMLEELLLSQKEASSFQESVDSLQLMFDEQREKVDNLTADLSLKNRLNEELRLELKASLDRNSYMEKHIEQLTQSLEDSVQGRSSLAQSVKEKDEIMQLLTRSKESLTIEASQFQERVALLNDEVVSLKDMVKRLQGSLSEREAELQVSKECLKRLKMLSEDGGNSALSIDKVFDIVQVQGKLVQAEKEYDKISEELQKASTSEKELKDAVTNLKMELEVLREANKLASKEREEAVGKLSILTQYFEEKEAQLAKELESREGLLLEAEDTSQSAVKKIQTYQTEIASYKNQIENLKKELFDQEQSLKTQISQEEQKTHESWLAARAAERRQEELRKENSQLRQRLMMMQSDSNSLIKPGLKRIDANGTLSPPVPSVDGELEDPFAVDGHIPHIPPPHVLPHFFPGLPPPPPHGLPPPFMGPLPPPPPHLPNRRVPPAGRMASPPFHMKGDSPVFDRHNYTQSPLGDNLFNHRQSYSPRRTSPDRGSDHSGRRSRSPTDHRHSPGMRNSCPDRDRWYTRSPEGYRKGRDSPSYVYHDQDYHNTDVASRLNSRPSRGKKT